MKAFFLTTLFCCLLFSSIFTQDSLRVQDSAKTKPQVIIGLNITRTVTGLLNANEIITLADPYQFTLRVGNDRRRWRAGLNFNNRKLKDDDDFNGERTTSTNEFILRNGAEWNFPVSNRFEFYWGLDVVTGYSREKVVTNFGGGESSISIQTTTLGFGPVTGIAFRIHPRVLLSTECSVHGLVKWQKEKVKAFPEVFSSSSTETQFGPVLPTSLFINYIF